MTTSPQLGQVTNHLWLYLYFYSSYKKQTWQDGRAPALILPCKIDGVITTRSRD